MVSAIANEMSSEPKSPSREAAGLQPKDPYSATQPTELHEFPSQLLNTGERGPNRCIAVGVLRLWECFAFAKRSLRSG